MGRGAVYGHNQITNRDQRRQAIQIGACVYGVIGPYPNPALLFESLDFRNRAVTVKINPSDPGVLQQRAKIGKRQPNLVPAGAPPKQSHGPVLRLGEIKHQVDRAF